MEQQANQVNENPKPLILPQAINLPIIHADKFAELNGLSKHVIGGWIDNGYLPTLKKGKYVMINLVALEQECKALATAFGGSK